MGGAGGVGSHGGRRCSERRRGRWSATAGGRWSAVSWAHACMRAYVGVRVHVWVCGGVRWVRAVYALLCVVYADTVTRCADYRFRLQR